MSTKKIAFLFLTIKGSDCSFIWNDFFCNINKKYYEIFCHPKFPKLVNDFLKPHIIENLVETNWGHTNLVTASINLIEEALKDKDIDSFILVSHNTAPLKDFFTIYNDLITSNKGYLHTYKYKDLGFKHHQWFIFNRDFAQIVIKNKKTINFFAKLINTKSYSNCFDEKWINSLADFLKLNLLDYFNSIKDCKTIINFIPLTQFSDQDINYEKLNIFDNSYKHNCLISVIDFNLPQIFSLEEYFNIYRNDNKNFFIRKVCGEKENYHKLLSDNNLNNLF